MYVWKWKDVHKMLLNLLNNVSVLTFWHYITYYSVKIINLPRVLLCTSFTKDDTELLKKKITTKNELILKHSKIIFCQFHDKKHVENNFFYNSLCFVNLLMSYLSLFLLLTGFKKIEITYDVQKLSCKKQNKLSCTPTTFLIV